MKRRYKTKRAWNNAQNRRIYRVSRTIFAWAQRVINASIRRHGDFRKASMAGYRVIENAMNSGRYSWIPPYLRSRMLESLEEDVIAFTGSMADVWVPTDSPDYPRVRYPKDDWDDYGGGGENAVY